MNIMVTDRAVEEISTAQEIIEEAKAGRCFILVDDENRENEGSIVIPAQFATADVLNFMACYARGLICLALTQQRIAHLKLREITQSISNGLSTSFALSIEARTGVTAKISATGRARTIAVAINPESAPNDVVTPGHIFPLIACDGGILVRGGHAEAAVDVARIAGLNPSGVVCEVMNDDGTVARLPELKRFARTHRLKIGSISDLIAYRLRNERVVKPVAMSGIHHPSLGEWRMVIYRDSVGGAEHIALIKGDVAKLGNVKSSPVLVGVHKCDLVSDLILARQGEGLRGAMLKIMRRGLGVIVLVNDGQPWALSERVRTCSPHRRPDPQLREYGIGAQILADIGVREMTMLSCREQTLTGTEGYKLAVG
jgi:3,4-dihydroxy 2-butanone 4-phosphate synthase/GTP cyclohydrolase II